MIRIPFKLWHSWTAEERTAVLTRYENSGKQWYLDLTEEDPHALQKDTDEARQEDWTQR